MTTPACMCCKSTIPGSYVSPNFKMAPKYFMATLSPGIHVCMYCYNEGLVTEYLKDSRGHTTKLKVYVLRLVLTVSDLLDISLESLEPFAAAYQADEAFVSFFEGLDIRSMNPGKALVCAWLHAHNIGLLQTGE